MRARYYDAEIGRFISEDPIGMAGGLNLYAYVGGNPLSFVDPDGKILVNATGAVFGGLSGGIGSYISSGGNLKETLLGAVVGAGAGVFSPATAIGNATVGFFSSLAGQTIGSGDYKNLDIGLATASALGGVGSRGLTQYLANSSRSSAAFVITRALGSTRPNAVNTFNAITDGFIGASAQITYQNLK